jgi:hypothetical protein
MSKADILTELANGHHVERIVCNVAREHSLTANLADLVQDIFVALMKYDEAVLVDLWDNGQMGFFVARIAMNNLRSGKSPYFQRYINFAKRSREITGREKWTSE